MEIYISQVIRRNVLTVTADTNFHFFISLSSQPDMVGTTDISDLDYLIYRNSKLELSKVTASELLDTCNPDRLISIFTMNTP